jgi:hypothetical protein
MLDRVEQQPRIGHLGQAAIEILRQRQALPERPPTMLGDERFWLESQ